jgi:hypothetical protein
MGACLRLSSHVGPWGDHAPTWAPDLGNEHLDGHAQVGAVPAPLVPRGTVG